MHELSIATDMVRMIVGALEGPRRLSAVNITVGPLSGVSADALRFCFGEVASESGLGEPELRIDEPAARLVCRECGAGYEARDFYDGCPSCGSLMRRITSGDELCVDSVELDEEEDDREEEGDGSKETTGQGEDTEARAGQERPTGGGEP